MHCKIGSSPSLIFIHLDVNESSKRKWERDLAHVVVDTSVKLFNDEIAGLVSLSNGNCGLCIAQVVELKPNQVTRLSINWMGYFVVARLKVVESDPTKSLMFDPITYDVDLVSSADASLWLVRSLVRTLLVDGARVE